MVATALALLLVGFVISVPTTALLIRLGTRWNALDSPGAAGHAKVLRRVPNIGGIAIAAAIALPLLLGLLLVSASRLDLVLALEPMVEPFLDRLLKSAPFGWAFLGGLLVIHLMGLIDDRRPLPALPKLVIQLGVAFTLAAFFDLRLLVLLDEWGAGGRWLSIALSTLWITAVINALNFLDNMDGLAGGVGFIAGALLLAAALIVEQWFIAGVLALLVGGLAGFMPQNFPLRGSARIFMGDGGSLVIGYVLAVMTIRITFTATDNPAYALGSAWYGVFMPLIILAVPLYDLIAVSILRVSQGRSPLVGDQQHLSHRLVERGLSRRQAVLVIWALTFITGVGGVSLGTVQPWQAVLIGVQTMATLLILGLLEHTVRR
ncbi:MAG: undecaprenyl/decaprenyl-phosphate alpha-N-acetylglucosaminyl 1-phosphate transferase [Phycisphaeraceae bacterium]|nr:undecaprenyl/decaprenyl-phosphate alpha-N-acetylglucosaminyl 1-phosphate transferase [Phycisphaeraceae bacterium]